MWLVLDLNPEPWRIGPISIGRRSGKQFANVGQDAQLANYKNAVKEAVGEQVEIHGKVWLTFYVWRLRSEYETSQSRTHRKHEADATNMQKATEDALQGIFYKNDKDVSDVRTVIVEQGPDVIPRIVVRIEPWKGLDPAEIPEYIWAQIDEAPQLFQNQDRPKLSVVAENEWNGTSEVDIF